MAGMGSRDVVPPLRSFDDIEDVVRFTQYAEELGYGYVSVGETNGWNVPLVLSVLADRTDEIGISEDVLSPFGRTPATLGQTAATLQEISDSRFRLRIGASSPELVEGWHGLEFERPLRRVREAVEIVRLVQSGERVDYDGTIFSLEGLRLACRPPEEPAPVDVAALGRKATELAGRFADGWVIQMLPINLLRERMDDLRRGTELGDRSADDVRVAVHLRCCALNDGERARELGRRQVGFVIARYGPFYRHAIADAGWGEVTERVRDHWDAGDREAAFEAVPDELLDDLVAVGTHDEVRRQVERFEAVDGVDAVQVGLLGDMTESERRDALSALAPK